MTSRIFPAKTPITSAGFSLIEVLVAFAIFVISLGTLLEVFGGGLRSADRGAAYSYAVLLAESHLAGVGATQPLESGETIDQTDEGYSIATKISPFEWEQSTRSKGLLSPYNVTVEVSWNDAGRRRNVSLSTIKLASSSGV